MSNKNQFDRYKYGIPNVYTFDMEKAFHLVIGYYREPWRVFHSWRHIMEGYETFMTHFMLSPNLVDQGLQVNRDKLVLAWLLHDVIYLPGFPHNELAAMSMVDYVCGELGVPRYARDVKYLILQTYHTGDVQDKAQITKSLGLPENYFVWGQEIIVDVDLYGFATTRCKENGDLIQREFHNFMQPQDEKEFELLFLKGRIEFNYGMLQYPIYRTDYAKEHWEHTARANIKKDIKRLETLVTNRS
jgi:predicted metal-dependent HD superfamily phosphohydrolase